MCIIKYKAKTPSLRHRMLVKEPSLLNKPIIKNLKKKIKLSVGRSSTYGRITCRHKGGGVSFKQRLFLSSKNDYRSIVLAREYFKKKKVHIALHFDLFNKKFFYTRSITTDKPGVLLQSKSNQKDVKLGNRCSFSHIPAGTVVCNVTREKSEKPSFVCGSGTYAQIINKINGYVTIRLPSGKVKKLSDKCTATIGRSSNEASYLEVLGKAGISRYLNKRPTVRGIAMNPVDHPHGGRTNGGIPSKTPWGLPTKSGFKLRKKYE